MRYDDRKTAIESPDRVEFEELETLEAELAFLGECDELSRNNRLDPEPEYLNQDWIDKNNY
jgi:hypothetical protein